MQYIIKGRQEGKTYDIVKILKAGRTEPNVELNSRYIKNDHVLIVEFPQIKKRLMVEYRLAGNEVMSLPEYQINEPGMDMSKKLLIDDVDNVSQVNFRRHRIAAVTMLKTEIAFACLRSARLQGVWKESRCDG